jgi:hypothetical protein
MKLNKYRIELLKNTEVIIHNQNLRKDFDLLNQILSKYFNCTTGFCGSAKYYGIKKKDINKYDWDCSDDFDYLMKWLKNPTSNNILIKPISWFFEEEEEEINNILLLI